MFYFLFVTVLYLHYLIIWCQVVESLNSCVLCILLVFVNNLGSTSILRNDLVLILEILQSMLHIKIL